MPLAFLVAIAITTLLLMLPAARADGGSADFMTAFFTATSAVCVTGLIVEDTATYWSGFGQFVILLAFQIGGFGIMTAATLLGIAAGRSLRLSSRLLASAERSQIDFTDAASVLKLVFGATFVVESVLALILVLRLNMAHGEAWGTALWNGVFHAISAFNNAGFSTYSDGLMGFQADGLFLWPIMVAITVSALGFPVLHELRHEWREPKRWSLHTRITLAGSAALLVLGLAGILLAEWHNPATLGPMGWGDKLTNASFHSVIARTTGFNTVDVGAFHEETLALNYVLMFIGGGSAGTAGGIKVTTFFLLGVVVWSEIRGEREAHVFGRRISPSVERQALSVVLLSMGLIGLGTVIILSITGLPLSAVLFETISAFATVGLSTGITGQLPASAELVLILLMFVGRVGTITAATALALGSQPRAYRYPEESPIVG